MKNFLAFLFGQSPTPGPRYRIIYDPEHGYCAQFRNWVGWIAIDPGGGEGVYERDIHRHPKNYFHPTQEDAGVVLNRHATSRGQRTVWES